MNLNFFKKKPDSDYEELQKNDEALLNSIENPFLNARRTWNTHLGSVVSSRQTWQIIGILGLLISLASVGGMIHIGSKSKFIPYVVEVDKHGRSFAIGPVTEAGQSDPRVVLAGISEFIESARLVTPDIKLQRKAVFKIYSMLSPNDPATRKMNKWLGSEETNPFSRATKETVHIEIESILPQTAKTWQVDWIETVYDRDGKPKHEPINMKALLTVYISQSTPETTEEDQRKNPIRLFVEDYNWTREL